MVVRTQRVARAHLWRSQEREKERVEASEGASERMRVSVLCNERERAKQKHWNGRKAERPPRSLL